MDEYLLASSVKVLVSVIIPFFNQKNFLAEAIESVVAQTYENWELILIDDGSIDGSFEIAQEFVNQYPSRIFLYTHKNRKNCGASSSRNLGMNHARGDFLTFLDSDDVFLPNTLEIEIKAFERNPDVDIVCGTSLQWFTWNNETNAQEPDFLVDLGFKSEKIYDPPSLLIHNLYAGGRKPAIGCIILKSEFAKKFAGFEDNFTFVSEDQIFWTKATLYGKIYVLKDCLAKYRQHSNSSSRILIEKGNIDADWENFSNWLKDFFKREKIKDQEILRAFEVWQKENNFRLKYSKIIRLYRRLFPYNIRYRIRDWITKWRMSG